MKLKVGIVGNGNVGSALRRGLERVGYPVRTVGKVPAKVHETGSWAEVIVLAVPYDALADALAELGDGQGARRRQQSAHPRDGAGAGVRHQRCGAAAEEGARRQGGEGVQQVFAEHMETGRLRDQSITLFAAGEDAEAKAQVLQLARDIGFDAVDAGPLRNARLLEALGYLNIQLGYVQKLGRQIGFKLLR